MYRVMTTTDSCPVQTSMNIFITVGVLINRMIQNRYYFPIMMVDIKYQFIVPLLIYEEFQKFVFVFGILLFAHFGPEFSAHIKILSGGAGEMSQHLRILAVLPKDLVHTIPILHNSSHPSLTIVPGGPVPSFVLWDTVCI